MQKDMNQFSPLPNWADQYDFGDRLSCLNFALGFINKGPDALKDMLAKDLSPDYPRDIDKAIIKTLVLIGRYEVDWNIVFSTINSCFDRVVAAQRTPIRPKRKKGGCP